MAKKFDRSAEAQIVELENELSELQERFLALKEKYDSLEVAAMREAADNLRLTIALERAHKAYDTLRNSLV